MCTVEKDLFKLEDDVKLLNLIKTNKVNFVDLESITWSKAFTEKIVNKLKQFKSEKFRNDFDGRWDEIKVEARETGNDVHDKMINATDVFTDGSVKHTLIINSEYTKQFDSFQAYEKRLIDESTPNANNVRSIVPSNLNELMDHEFAHVLTVPNNAHDEFWNRYFILQPELEKLSEYAWFDESEALAEIFTAHRKGISINEELITFFNKYSSNFKIPE